MLAHSECLSKENICTFLEKEGSFCCPTVHMISGIWEEANSRIYNSISIIMNIESGRENAANQVNHCSVRFKSQKGTINL